MTAIIQWFLVKYVTDVKLAKQMHLLRLDHKLLKQKDIKIQTYQWFHLYLSY